MTTQPVEEAAIRQQVDKLVEAIRSMDIESLKPMYAPDIVSFDAQPPLKRVGVEGKCQNWVDAFTIFRHPLGYEICDFTITVDGDVAFAHSFNRLSGTLKNGNRTGGFWVRATYCFRKVDGHWLVAHDHVSVPFDVETGTAVLGLEPDPLAQT